MDPQHGLGDRPHDASSGAWGPLAEASPAAGREEEPHTERKVWRDCSGGGPAYAGHLGRGERRQSPLVCSISSESTTTGSLCRGARAALTCTDGDIILHCGFSWPPPSATQCPQQHPPCSTEELPGARPSTPLSRGDSRGQCSAETVVGRGGGEGQDSCVHMCMRLYHHRHRHCPPHHHRHSSFN